MSRSALFLCSTTASVLAANTFSQSSLSQYKGLPYRDTRCQGGAQKIPGRVWCAYYDLSSEGIAYHDTDPQNHGSGELNPAGFEFSQGLPQQGEECSYCPHPDWWKHELGLLQLQTGSMTRRMFVVRGENIFA